MIIFLFFLLFWCGLSFKYSFIIFPLVGLFIAFIVFKKYKIKFALIGLAIFSIGIGVSYIHFDHQQTTYEGMVIESHDNYFLFLSKGEKLYVYNHENTYEMGDYLAIEGKKEKNDFTTIESQFDFNEYLEKKGVIYSLNAYEIVTKWSNPIRLHAKRKEFLSHFDTDTSQIVGSLLFSDYDDSSTIDCIKNLHLARLVNMSGIYLYVFIGLFEFFFSFLIKRKWARLAANGLLIPYYLFTLPRLTVMRVFVLQILRWINKYPLKHRFTSFDIIGITGFFFLVIDYHYAYQDSFIIGFSLPWISALINESSRTKKGWKKKLYQISLMYLLILPFEIKYYNGINPFLLPLQYLLTPLFMVFAIASLLSFYRIPIYKVVDVFAEPLKGISSFFSKIVVEIYVPPFSKVICFLYIVTLLAIYFYRALGLTPIHFKASLALTVFSVLYCLPITNLISASVTFIDVGQGDSCLIQKGTTSVLIDTGGNIYRDIAKETLIPYFKKNRIYDIDLVITTHGDFDHSGALPSLKENFYVKNVITDYTEFPITLGGITFNNYNMHIDELEEENDKSLVIGFNLMHKDFLITGDAPIAVEKNIIKEFPNLQCDILKLGHHGSKTSSCDEFIKFTSPDVAIISCGKKNKYGHPNASVINILKKNKVPYRRTDEEGSIRFSNYIFM